MRIGIDLSSVCRRTSGIEYYALHVARALLQADKENEYVLFFSKETHPELRQPHLEFEERICPVGNQIFCEQIWLPLTAANESLDLIHFPAFPPSPLNWGRTVLTVHDATVWRLPDTTSKKGRCYFKGLYKLSMGRSKRVVTYSQNSRDEISRFASLPKEKIVAIYPAANEVFQPMRNENRLRTTERELGLPRHFILTVGTIEPRKNHLTLIQVYETLRRRYGFKHKLVIVGRKAWGYKQLIGRINRSLYKDDILLTGFIPTSQLVAVYNLAQLFIYPSVYEGFGLPPLEAMSCGCPVVASNSSSLPEVVADAGILIDPYDVEAMAEAVTRLLEDGSLRETMITKGFDRARTFTWEKAALATLRVYREAAAA